MRALRLDLEPFGAQERHLWVVDVREPDTPCQGQVEVEPADACLDGLRSNCLGGFGGKRWVGKPSVKIESSPACELEASRLRVDSHL